MSNPKKRAAPSQDAEGQKKKKKKSAYHVDETLLNGELGINEAFAVMDNQLLADYTAQKIARFGTDLSPVELSDLSISDDVGTLLQAVANQQTTANSIKDTTSWTEPRALEKLPEFLEKFAEKPERLGTAPEKKGAPHTIIVAGAGLRAADIVRAVRKFQSKKSTVSKLFAKHMKVDEQVKFLQNTRTGIAVGTPARLMELADNGALSLEKLQRIVVDASHIDQKKRGVMDMKDTMLPLARWLTRQEFKERYVDDKKHLDLLFY
ncbi:protein CMS1 [Colletotrichum spaethianum]|uniref:Protein CMS1 n=1 Tax=Colletotrichum spaethianum TaxID=700344 RepID=A0AA37LCV4_9PEZI|nr:protein CMS1 [Colletotrichum spaethianum]GKT46021.1 protein CMS1 [Colletotrichum spaethianum]